MQTNWKAMVLAGAVAGAVVVVGLLARDGVRRLAEDRADEQRRSQEYAPSGGQADLPTIRLVPGEIDRLVLKAGAKPEFTFEKKGGQWTMTGPHRADANEANIKSLLDNLSALKVSEVINPDPEQRARYGLTPEKAVHVVASRGETTALEVWFGEDGSRGQMAEVGKGTPVVALRGYSSWLYDRPESNWTK